MRITHTLLVGLAIVATAAPASADDRQAVADLDATAAAHARLGRSTTADEARRDEAVDRWLRGELETLRGANDDASISQARLIAATARERHRDVIANAADVRVDAMIEARAPELQPMIQARAWLAALTQIETWVPADAPGGQATKSAIRGQIAAAIEASAAAATTSAERYLAARMHTWFGATPDASADTVAMQALVATAIDYHRGAGTCPHLTTLLHANVPSGIPVTVEVTLGECGLTQRSGVEQRTAEYTVQVTRQRQETYYVDQAGTVEVPTSSQECHQETHDVSGGSGPRNDVIVAVCTNSQGSKTERTVDRVARTRTVDYVATEPRDEAFAVSTLEISAAVDLAITITGEGQTMTLHDRASASEHDEQFTRVHGDSKGFRSNLDAIVSDELEAAAQRLVERGFDEWALARGRTRLDHAAAATDPHARRALAIEAVLLAPSLAEQALPLVDLPLTPPQLAAVIAGTPVLAVLPLAPGAGLALPPVSEFLRLRLEHLEQHHALHTEAHGRDGMFGMGVGITKQGDLDNAGSLAIEVQQGFAPAFTADSRLLARLELDIQLLGSNDPQLDVSVRPEVGIHLGLLDLGVVGTVGGRASYIRIAGDPDEAYDGHADAYAGYGGHATIYVGKVLVDALALRLYPTGAAADATRLDGMVGYRVMKGVYAAARLRYVAQAELSHAFAPAPHVASGIIAMLVEY